MRRVSGRGTRGRRAAPRRQFAGMDRDLLVAAVAMVLVVAGLTLPFVFLTGGEEDARGEASSALRTPDTTVPPTSAEPQDESTARGRDPELFPQLVRAAERESRRKRCTTKVHDEQFTAVSFNIKSGRMGGLGRPLGTLQRSGASVILLQEVDNRRRSTGSVDQAGYFADALGGWHHAFGQNVAFGDGLYGTAVVSKYPIVSSTNHRLPNIGRAQPRGLLHVVIDVDGVEVSVYSTHLDNTSERIRTMQASSIASIVRADPRPKILGGDMNAWPGARPAQILTSALTDTWAAVGSGGGATHPANRPRGRIDYLMHGGPKFTAQSSDVMPDVTSDHRAVRANYELAGISTRTCVRPKKKPVKESAGR